MKKFSQIDSFELASAKGYIPSAKGFPCEKCGEPAKHRHHDDYSKPFDVMMLCVRCHFARHKELGWGFGGGTKGQKGHNMKGNPNLYKYGRGHRKPIKL